MRLFGLIGYPLGHSFSQRYFTEKFASKGITDARYELFPLPDISALPHLLHLHPDLCGLNVTIPYKEAVIPYLDKLDDTAQGVGAVNCIRIREGEKTGFNTDVWGFEQSFRTDAEGILVLQPNAKALVLGTGGASKAVAWVLAKMSISVLFVSRAPEGQQQIGYEAMAHLPAEDYRFIINTTPVGTYPKVDDCPPIPFDWLQPEQLMYDLVYNPPETLLLRRAADAGCFVKNGLEMLHGQAEQAWKIWNEPFNLHAPNNQSPLPTHPPI